MLVDPAVHSRVAGRARASAGPALVDGRTAARVEEVLCAHRADLARAEDLGGVTHEVLRLLGDDSAPQRIDRRVEHALDLLRDPAIERRRILEGCGVSEAHLSALFVRDVGVAIRTYRVCQRTVAAVIALRRASATTAAHAAGFADLAHFSRACRGMLGYSPREVQAALNADRA
jgi:AraC-like DNA-binding protein